MIHFAVYATQRANLEDVLVSLAPDRPLGERAGKQIIAWHRDKFIRCLVKPVELEPQEVAEVWYAWGLTDGKAHHVIDQANLDKLPEAYREAYAEGFLDGSLVTNDD